LVKVPRDGTVYRYDVHEGVVVLDCASTLWASNDRRAQEEMREALLGDGIV